MSCGHDHCMVSFRLKTFLHLHHLQSVKSYEVVKLTGIKIPEQITRCLHDVASEAPDLNQKGSSIQKSRRDFPPFKAVRQIAGNYGCSSFQNIQECQTFRYSVRHNLSLSGSFLLDTFLPHLQNISQGGN